MTSRADRACIDEGRAWLRARGYVERDIQHALEMVMGDLERDDDAVSALAREAAERLNAEEQARRAARRRANTDVHVIEAAEALIDFSEYERIMYED